MLTRVFTLQALSFMVRKQWLLWSFANPRIVVNRQLKFAVAPRQRKKSLADLFSFARSDRGSQLLDENPDVDTTATRHDPPLQWTLEERERQHISPRGPANVLSPKHSTPTRGPLGWPSRQVPSEFGHREASSRDNNMFQVVQRLSLSPPFIQCVQDECKLIFKPVDAAEFSPGASQSGGSPTSTFSPNSNLRRTIIQLAGVNEHHIAMPSIEEADEHEIESVDEHPESGGNKTERASSPDGENDEPLSDNHFARAADSILLYSHFNY